MNELLQSIRRDALEKLNAARDISELEALRVKLLGKKGEITAVLKQMGSLSAEERPAFGKEANEVRTEVEERLSGLLRVMSERALEAKLKSEALDVTLPGEQLKLGHRHPMLRVLSELEDIFLGMGFNIVEGPEVENDKYNFEMLNIPQGHPARDTQDTFYVTDNILLRTQTSPVQVRTMLRQKPPIRVIAPGRVFRSDTADATHSPVFTQIEGLVVDKGITMSDLRGTLGEFAKKLYGENTRLRFRPHHFPFTEPSAEMDCTCFKCGGKGCSLCKGEGFIEILGCGMVHPKVLEGCGIDSSVYSGFAFGIGLERITTMRYAIDDLRLLLEDDISFLEQF